MESRTANDPPSPRVPASMPAGRRIRYRPASQPWDVYGRADDDLPRDHLLSWPGFLLIGASGGVVFWTVWRIVRDKTPTWHNTGILAGALLVLLLILLASRLDLTGLLVREDRLRHHRAPRIEVSPGRLTLVAVSLAGVGLAMYEQYAANLGRVGWNVALPWLVGMLAAGFAAWLPDLQRPGWCTWPIRWHAGLLRGAILVLLAFGTRFIWPGNYPAVIDGDEAVFLQMARDARNGVMFNPFGTGWLEVPTLYPAVMGWISHLTSDTVAGYRVLTPLLGAITVIATWRFGVRVVGAQAAFYGAMILAVMPIHLMFSRTALFHISDPAFLVLTVLFLHRAVQSNRAGDAWIAGTMVGLGWYGYWGARTFPVIVMLLLLLVARPLGRIITLGFWAAAGFLCTTAPLLAWFLRSPDGFGNRFSTTSIRSTAEWAENPRMAILMHIRLAIVQPFVESWDIFYKHQAPFVGWPEAMLFALGIAAVAATLIRTAAWRSFIWLALPPLFLIAGLGTIDIVQPHRLLIITPFWALIMGAGGALTIRWLASIPLRVPHLNQTLTGLAMVGLVALATMNLSWFYKSDRIILNWSSEGTVGAWDLGWRLDEDHGATVLLAGPPYTFAGSFPGLQFERPNATIDEVVDPIMTAADVPTLDHDSVLVLVPARQSERCVIEESRPDYTVYEVRHNDTLLYIAYALDPVAGWATGTTPAGTTTIRVDPQPCSSSAETPPA